MIPHFPAVPARFSRVARIGSWAAVPLALWLLAGCARTSTPDYYLMPSLADSAAPVESPATTGSDAPYIGVGPVDLADYLDRPQIVTRSGQGRVDLAEFHKWAGDLKNRLPVVLADNLSVILGTDRVLMFPWKSVIPVRFQVTVSITRLDALPSSEAILAARWAVLDQDGRRLRTTRTSDIRVPITGEGFPAIVAAQGKALERLSRDIAAVLTELSSKRK